MSSSLAKSPVVRFLEAFLQERNIRWLLLSGLAILFASSVVLVGSQWSNLSDVSRYGLILGYIAATYVAARVTWDRIGLRRTGTSLFGLMVLLIPLSFQVPGWLFHFSTAALFQDVGLAGLVAVHLAGATMASVDICRRLLVKISPTFLFAYLTLSAAGLLVPALGPGGVMADYAFPACLLLCGVMTVGVIKVHRHVFWLTEEYRAPRVFGFLPVGLLLALLMMFTFAVSPQVDSGLLGVLISLSSISILSAAESLHRVFRVRTGELVEETPWSILVPLFVGLAISLAGTSLAAIAFWAGAGSEPLVGCLLILMASLAFTGHRLRQSDFTTGAILAGLAIYCLIPTLTPDLTQAVLARAAQMLGEPTVPVAFLPIAMLPALVTLRVAGRIVQRRQLGDHWSAPIANVGTILAIAMLPVGLSHPLGWAITGSAMFAVLVSTAMLRPSRLALGGVVASLFVTGTGLGPWMDRILDQGTSFPTASLGFALATGVLVVMRRRLAELSDRRDESATMLTWTAVVATYLVTASTIASSLGPMTTTVAVLIPIALVLQIGVLRLMPTPVLAGMLLASGQLAALRFQCAFWMPTGIGFADTFAPLALLLVTSAAGLWLAACWLDRRTDTLSRAVVNAAGHFVRVELFALALTPVVALAEMILSPSQPDGGLINIAYAMTAVTLAHVAIRQRSFALGAAGSLGLIAFVTMQAIPFLPFGDTLVLAVALASSAMTLVGTVLSRREMIRPLVTPMAWVSGCILVAVMVATSFMTSANLFAAHGVAILTGVVVAMIIRDTRLRTMLLAISNWPLVLLGFQLLHLGTAGVHHWANLTNANFFGLMPSIALIAGMSALVWMLTNAKRQAASVPIASAQVFLLTSVAILASLGSLAVPDGHWNLGHSVCMGSVALAAMFVELRNASRHQDERLVRMAYGFLAGFVALLFWHGQITMNGAAPVVLASLGFVLHGVAVVLGRILGYQIAQPFTRQLSVAMPTLAAVIATGAEFLLPTQAFPWNMIGLYISAAFFAWRSIETKDLRYVLSAAIVGNLALATTWLTFGLDDPELFMIPIGATILALVESLRQRIPTGWHDPLRYAGSLIILVSPIGPILDGSGLGYITLMAASLVIILASIGLQIRALLYAETAFLVGDLVAIVVRGCQQNPDLLWATGLIVGTAVVALAAYCERRRENILGRIELLSAALAQWK